MLLRDRERPGNVYALEGIDPVRWAPFRGITVLFDNSAAGLPSADIEFYDQLESFTLQHASELDMVSLACLPRSTYHVILLDLVTTDQPLGNAWSPVTLRFHELAIWTNAVLVARLRLDAAGERVTTLRTDLNARMLASSGIQASPESTGRM